MLNDLSPSDRRFWLASFTALIAFLSGIFKYYSGRGRRKASKLFKSSGGELKHAIYSHKKVDEGLYSFLPNEIEKQNIDKEWVKRFFKVSHWCGYQVLIRKESNVDLEKTTSIAYDMEIINKLDKINYSLFTETVVDIYKTKISKR